MAYFYIPGITPHDDVTIVYTAHVLLSNERIDSYRRGGEVNYVGFCHVLVGWGEIVRLVLKDAQVRGLWVSSMESTIKLIM